jgi:hypothetical protein
MNSYYIIKKIIPEKEDAWGKIDFLHTYLYGLPSYYGWTCESKQAKKFKSITDIRRFITTSLKSGLASYDNDIGDWIFWQINIIPAADVITPVHTMGLLRSVHER